MLAFIGGEVFFRIFYPQAIQPESIHEYVYGINNGLRANVSQRWSDKDYNVLVSTNSKRLRGEEYPYEKGEGGLRILALGDSFTFGFGVNIHDSYTKVLETLLNADKGVGENRKYEVINAGAPGWGTAQELVFWNIEGQKYNPDIVTLCMVENDPQDNINAGLFDLKDGSLSQREAKKNLITNIRELIRKVPLVNYLAQHSHLYNFVRMRALHAMYSRISRGEEIKISDDTTSRQGVKVQKQNESQADALTIALLTKLFADIKQSRQKIILFDVPGALRKFPKIHEFVLQEAADERIVYLDTRAFLEANLHDEESTYLNDGHWNIKGHRLAATMLANFLTQNRNIVNK